MFELVCLNLLTDERFSKIIYNKWALKSFKKKCEFSNKIKIIGIISY